MPLYKGSTALSSTIKVPLLPSPFPLIACFTDPMPRKLLPIAHALMTVLLLGIFVTSSN